MTNIDTLAAEGIERAEDLVRQAATPEGFVASTTKRDNYKRIWARDGVIISLAVLMMDDEEMNATVLATLRTLMRNLGPHGEVPSNVDPHQGHISYGGTAGRVDASLWFVVGVHQYWRRTQDNRFLEEFFPALQKIEFLLGAWEFNTKGFIYIPETGDWADEYLQHGYVLYDQLLYFQALQGLCDMYRAKDGKENHILHDKMGRLRDLIRANFWFHACTPDEVDAYHPVIFEKGCEAAETKGTYWMPYFSPSGYGYRFDSFANVLASLLHVADEEQIQATDAYIEEKIISKDMRVLPAFSPVIDEKDEDWKDLQVTFSNSFKNHPYEFHNGGLWPLITGFYAADLAARGQFDRARQYADGIHASNALSQDDTSWGFYEFVNGKTYKPGGTRHQTWSASAAIMAEYALKREYVLI